MKNVGDILNPLCKCYERMIKAGLGKKKQCQAGKEELLNRMARFFESKIEAVVVED